MAEVDLTQVWIHKANDADTVVKLDDTTGISEGATIAGDVYRFATGRRWITQGINWRVIEVVALNIPRTDVDLLRTWVGELLVYRDPTGRIVWGVYQDLDIKESAETLLTYVNEIGFQFEETLGDVEV